MLSLTNTDLRRCAASHSRLLNGSGSQKPMFTPRGVKNSHPELAEGDTRVTPEVGFLHFVRRAG